MSWDADNPKAIDSDLLLSLCQEPLQKLTAGHGPHPGAGRLAENLPEATPDQGQQPGTGKIIYSFDGRVEVPLETTTCGEF